MVNARYSCSQGFNGCDCWHNSLLWAIDIGAAIDGCSVVFIIFFFSLWAEFLSFHSTDHLLPIIFLRLWNCLSGWVVGLWLNVGSWAIESICRNLCMQSLYATTSFFPCWLAEKLVVAKQLHARNKRVIKNFLIALHNWLGWWMHSFLVQKQSKINSIEKAFLKVDWILYRKEFNVLA